MIVVLTVCAVLLCPCIPSVKVEGRLGRCTGYESVDAAVVVVKLDHDEVETHPPVQHYIDWLILALHYIQEKCLLVSPEAKRENGP